MIREAAQVVDDLLARYPEDSHSQDVLAWFYYRFGRADDAFDCWEQCLELDPAFVDAYTWMGTIAREKGDHEKAIECFTEGLEWQPDSERLAVELARSLMDVGRTDDAVVLLEKHVAIQPRSMPILVLLGDAYSQLEEHEKAKASLEKAISISPDFVGAYYSLARACTAVGDEEKAAEYSERFKVLKAEEEESHRTGVRTADYEATVRYQVAGLFTAAAKAYLFHGDPQTAETSLLRAIEVCPTHLGSIETIVWLYERQHRAEDALQQLLAAKEANPNELSVAMMLGRLYVGLGQLEAAGQSFRDAIDISPREADGYVALAGLSLDTNHELPEARKLAAKAVELEPVARNFYLLSMAHMKVNELADARAALEHALALEPGNTMYRQIYDKLGQRQAE